MKVKIFFITKTYSLRNLVMFVSREIDPGLMSSSQSQNKIVKYCVLQICKKICSSAPGRPDDPSRVLC
jgi:hypothetical protein